MPANAVTYGQDGAFVLVAAGDVARRRAVQTGLNAGGWVEIVAGVDAGERVVAGAPAGLSDGAAVRVTAP